MPFSCMALICSILIVINSDNWFTMWMMMEMSTMSFISMFFFLMTKHEESIVYFMIQSVSSFFIMVSLINSESLKLMLSFELLFILSLGMKVGVAPFHNWVYAVTIKLNKTMFFMITSIQKIVPFLWLLSSKSSSFLMLSVISMLNSILIAPQIIYQASVKGLLITSSISQNSWLFISCISHNLWIFYFIIYSLHVLVLLSYYNYSMKTLFQSSNNTLVILYLLSLAGIPPMIGFYPKLLILNIISLNFLLALMMILVVMSLIDLYAYSSVGLNSLLIKKSSLKWKKKISYGMLLPFTIVSLMMLSSLMI